MNPTAKVRLGRTKVEVTRLGLGGAPLGDFYEKLPEEQAQATVAAALDAGIGVFDTAPLYGLGLSEHRMGAVLRRRPRDSFTLSTKVGRYLVPAHGEKIERSRFTGGLEFKAVFDYSYDGARRSLEQSLHRLGLSRVDILLIHDVDIWTHGTRETYEQRFKEAMDGAHRAMVDLRSLGVVGAIGVGVNEVESARRFVEAGDFDCIMLAGRYTLLEQGALDDFLPLTVKKQVGILLAGPYNSGILATGPVPHAKYDYQDAPPEVMERARRLEAACRRHGVALPAAAIQFPLGHPSVASIVPGAVKPEEVKRNLDLMSTPIPAELWSELKQEGLIRADAPVPG